MSHTDDSVRNVFDASSVRASFVVALLVAHGCDDKNKDPDGSAESPTAKADQNDGKETKEVTEPTKPDKKHFDVSKDNSGVLARTAAALETEEAYDNENLRGISHGAKKLPSVARLCKHEVKVLGEGDDISECVKDHEHHLVQLGPELYAQWADCLLGAESAEEIEVCDEAEQEAEEALHAKPHGDGLDDETCESFFDHFEKLAMADAGDDAKLVEGILEEVKQDVLVTCKEQGMKKEIECAMKAEELPGLKDCASTLI